MRYIERVESSLKGGCTVDLGQRTVIVGPNGSGKSTIVQAIELATSGSVSDMEGRGQVKQTTALARLFPVGASKYAWCRLSTSEEFSWELEDAAKKGAYKKPLHEAPAKVSWPFQELAGVLGGDAGTVQSWLESQVFGPITKEDALAKLPPSIRSTVENLMGRKRKTDFLSLAKDAKSEARNLRSQATKLEKTVDSLVEGIAPPLTDAARKELESKPVSDARHLSEEEYEAERTLITELADAYATFEAAIENEPGNQMVGKLDMLNKVQVAMSLIKQHKTSVGEPTEYCWVCGSHESDQSHEDQVGAAMEMLGDALAYQKRCVSSQQKLIEIEEKLKQMVHDNNRAVIGEAKPDPQLKLAKDDVVRKAWANADATKAEAAQLRAKADALTSAAKSLSSVGRDLLTKAKSDFEKKVNDYLPEGDVFEIDLASSRVGLRRGDALHSALSGAEWNRVLMAISCGVVHDSTLNVLVPPDRAWDQDTLEHMMKALSTAEVQIVVMTTVKPEPVEGWTLVDLTVRS